MSVGGIVIKTVNCGDKVWINTLDNGVKCAIYVENIPAARCVQAGDIVWWQAGIAYWTTANKKIIEYKLKKVGYSGIEVPSPAPCSKFEASEYENTMCERCEFLERDHIKESKS